MKPRVVDTWDCHNEKPGQMILYHGCCHISIDAGEQGIRLAAINCSKQVEIERLQKFLQERVTDGLLKKHGGYHGKRLHLEAERLLRDPEWFPGKQAAEAGGGVR